MGDKDRSLVGPGYDCVAWTSSNHDKGWLEMIRITVFKGKLKLMNQIQNFLVPLTIFMKYKNTLVSLWSLLLNHIKRLHRDSEQETKGEENTLPKAKIDNFQYSTFSKFSVFNIADFHDHHSQSGLFWKTLLTT